MAESQNTPARCAVNPAAFERDLLQLTEGGLAVETRLDIGAIELIIRDRGDTAEVVILGPEQATLLACRLLHAALAVYAAELEAPL